MTLFNHYKGCIGLTLFRTKKRNAELWFFPSGTVLPPHTHNEENIEVMYLFGSTTFYRVNEGVNESYTPKWWKIGKLLSVPAGTIHWFTVGRLPLLAINFAHFLGEHEAKSAVDDLQIAR